jgi:hypothetical protein
MKQMDTIARALPFIYTGVVGIALVLFFGISQASGVRDVDSTNALVMPAPSSEGRVCSQDMVKCSDGSYAPRDPNNYCLPSCSLPTPKTSCVPVPTWCSKNPNLCNNFGINWCTSSTTRPTPSFTSRPTSRPSTSPKVTPSTCPLRPDAYSNYVCPNGGPVKIDSLTCRPTCPVDEIQ